MPASSFRIFRPPIRSLQRKKTSPLSFSASTRPSPASCWRSAIFTDAPASLRPPFITTVISLGPTPITAKPKPPKNASRRCPSGPRISPIPRCFIPPQLSPRGRSDDEAPGPDEHSALRRLRLQPIRRREQQATGRLPLELALSRRHPDRRHPHLHHQG